MIRLAGRCWAVPVTLSAAPERSSCGVIGDEDGGGVAPCKSVNLQLRHDLDEWTRDEQTERGGCCGEGARAEAEMGAVAAALTVLAAIAAQSSNRSRDVGCKLEVEERVRRNEGGEGGLKGESEACAELEEGNDRIL